VRSIYLLAPWCFLALEGQTFSPTGHAEVIDLHTNLAPTWTGGALVEI